MKLDILAFAAHPDDVELACSGTLMKHIDAGYSAGIVDLTRGELGTRGSADLREREAAASSKVLGISARENLALPDGFFEINRESTLKVIEQIRRFRPQVVFCNSISDRHPDHGRAAKLVSEACFYSGLRKIESQWQGEKQEAWRPQAVYHYIQDYYIKPDFVVDITAQWERKIESVRCFSSQFFNPESQEPNSPISTPEFMEFLEGRARDFGRPTGFTFAEGFTLERALGVEDVMGLK